MLEQQDVCRDLGLHVEDRVEQGKAKEIDPQIVDTDDVVLLSKVMLNPKGGCFENVVVRPLLSSLLRPKG